MSECETSDFRDEERLHDLFEVVANAIPGPEQTPASMDEILERVPEATSSMWVRRYAESLVAALVDVGDVAMFALGPRTMGNGKSWLYYRWTPLAYD